MDVSLGLTQLHLCCGMCARAEGSNSCDSAAQQPEWRWDITSHRTELHVCAYVLLVPSFQLCVVSAVRLSATGGQQNTNHVRVRHTRSSFPLTWSEQEGPGFKFQADWRSFSLDFPPTVQNDALLGRLETFS